MAKAPAFQFYVRDWLSDPLLRQATPLSRGIWIDVLCFMWEADQRGKLETTPLKLSRMASASIDEVNHFLNEMVDLEFGDFITENKLSFPITTQFCNEYVTIINRRMYSDYKGKENTRLRVKKHRRKKTSNDDETEKKQKCNGDVTVTSSSSSSSSSSKIKRSPKNGDFFQQKAGPYFESIESSCLKILNLPIKNSNKPFNPCQFINRKINKDNCHPGAIDECLKQLINYWKTIESPWSYANNILKTSDGNWWEKENIRDHEKLKQDFNDFIADSLIKDLVQDIGEAVK